MGDWVRYTGSTRHIGGKAASLAQLAGAGLSIPEWFALTPRDDVDADAPWPPDLADELREAVRRLAPNGERLAVRSSAVEEDGAAHSFAGQFESYLYVAPDDVPARVRDVWRSAASERLDVYRRERGLDGYSGATPAPGKPAVLVQRMIDPVAAGVAFSVDPASGRHGICVVTATWGVGSALVGGDVDGDTFHVSRGGVIVHRVIADKPVAHRAGADGPREEAVAPDMAARPALSDEDVVRVAALARAAARHFGMPQDIEWALADGRLFLLQARPITSLATLPDPDGELALWDNSNIAESYGGVTTPLTYSFARYVYENVYEQFCRIVGVPERRIADHHDAFAGMLGLVRGRVYYNLVSWYRVLALFPGYRLNRRFMEQMMGVSEPVPPEVDARIAASAGAGPSRLGDAFSVARTMLGLVVAQARLDRDVPAFHARLRAALAGSGDLTTLRADELVSHYRELERQLLRRWDAPLVNDFFAMIFYGALRSLSTRWCGDADGTLQNDLVSADGTIISAEPAIRVAHMGQLAAAAAQLDPALVSVLSSGGAGDALSALRRHEALAHEFDDYMARFGDRCVDELKLETVPLADDPLPVLRTIGALALRDEPSAAVAAARVDLRGDAERRAFAALRGRPLRTMLFRWVMRRARRRVRDRENLRFERTRVFGRVRQIFMELGKRYAAVGALDAARDVFYLTVDEALGWAGGTTASADLRALVTARRAEFAAYADLPAPPDRFASRGLVHRAGKFAEPAIEEPDVSISSRSVNPSPDHSPEDERRGIGCYPGVVRGRARVVREARGATVLPGEILVAERTDPGWVMLFASAAGLAVERGSLLSHSAIVARELGLPAVVSVRGLTSWLHTGDEVELDGRTGMVRRIAPATPRSVTAQPAAARA